MVGFCAPVRGVADQLHVLVLLELHRLERARADDRHRVAEGVAHLVGAQLAPDVLRQDVDVHLREQHVGLGRAAVDLERGVVDRDGLLHVLEVDGQAHLVLDDGVEREGHVARRERLAVLPLHARADLERPLLLVGGELPVLGEPGLLGRQAVGADGDERVVVEQPDLVRVAVADEGVEVERALAPAQAQGDLAGGRRRRRRGGCGRGDRPDARSQECEQDDDGDGERDDALPSVPTVASSVHGGPPGLGSGAAACLGGGAADARGRYRAYGRDVKTEAGTQ